MIESDEGDYPKPAVGPNNQVGYIRLAGYSLASSGHAEFGAYPGTSRPQAFSANCAANVG
jgi:hypothetical protein